MLRTVGLLSLAAALVVAGCDDDETGPEPEVYRATLVGGEEVPPVTTTASGTATFTVNGNQISYVVQITNWPTDGRTVNNAHIHNPPDQTGRGTVLLGWPAASITATGGSGTVPVSDAQLATIRAGGTYFNVHSTTNPGGEIRGDLERQ